MEVQCSDSPTKLFKRGFTTSLSYGHAHAINVEVVCIMNAVLDATALLVFVASFTVTLILETSKN